MSRHRQTRYWLLPIAYCLLLSLAGCGPSQKQFDQARSELFDANEQLRQAREENAALGQTLSGQQQQIQTLQNLGERRLERLYIVQRIDIGRYSTGQDTDQKPGDDAVKVFVVPYDQQGSAIKAAGAVKIELYDLGAPQEQNLLARCSYDVQQTAEHWYSGFAAYHYSFVCQFDRPPSQTQVTVRVEFTDYLTGKTFIQQRAVNVQLRPSTQPAK